MAKTVSVTVSDSGVVTASPDPLDVGKSNGTVVINFDMATDGWEITDITGLPSDEFTEQGKNGKGWKVKDKNDNTLSYKYDIKLKATVSGEEKELDPIIKNGGRG